MSVLSFNRLSYQTPDGRPLQRNINVTLESGQMLLISGANGCGKSTLLKAVLGRHTNYSGGMAISIGKDDTAYIPQLENTEIHFPLTLRDVLSIARDRKLNQAKALAMGLLREEQLSSAWNTASGGERKRTLLTRALLSDPSLLILDEPMNHLDSESRGAMIRAMADFLGDDKRQKAIVMVCHQGLRPDEAQLFSYVPLDLDAERAREGLC